MHAHGTLYLAQQRQQAGTTRGGAFQVLLLCFDRIGPHRVEPWRLLWAGDEARAWWQAHGAALRPGQPLTVQAQGMRTHVLHGRCEVHASVTALALAPWKHAAQPAHRADESTTTRPAVAA